MKNLNSILLIALTSLIFTGCIEQAANNAFVSCSTSFVRLNEGEREACRTGVSIAEQIAQENYGLAPLPWERQEALSLASNRCNEQYRTNLALAGACARGVQLFVQELDK